MKRPAALALGLTVVVAAFALLLSNSSKAAVHQPPHHMLWAWERPEDLRFADASDLGVAYLSSTIKVRDGKAVVINRHQPLLLAPNSYLMAVIRIESDGKLKTSDDKVLQQIVTQLPMTLKPGVTAIQFDFDARQSEREWYKKLLLEARRHLPSDCFLSMTSLASWCLGDDWISSMHLPVDEVVPMFFDMGADTQTITTGIETGKTFGHKFRSIGIRNDETAINTALAKSRASVFKSEPRIYIFSHRPWNPEKTQRIVQEVDRWK